MDSQTIGAVQRKVCQTENIKGYIRRVICGSLSPTLSHCVYTLDDNCDEDCGEQKEHSALICSTGNAKNVTRIEITRLLILIKG